MWTKTKSLFLSRILTIVMTAVILMLTFFVPYLSKWYNTFSVGNGFFPEMNVTVPMTVVLYVNEFFALCASAALYVLLKNIDKGEVFIDGNAKCLRIISWACMLAGCAFFVLGLWRFAFMLAAFFAVFFGLIMRVLKNVFEKAIEIKSENDFTI